MSASDFDAEHARAMRLVGAAWIEIARHFGRSADFVRRRLDPSYTARRRENLKTRRQTRKELAERAPVLRPHLDTRPTCEEIAARLAEIPPDTRDLTARIMNDPLPGRSALDRKMAEAN